MIRYSYTDKPELDSDLIIESAHKFGLFGVGLIEEKMSPQVCNFFFLFFYLLLCVLSLVLKRQFGVERDIERLCVCV